MSQFWPPRHRRTPPAAFRAAPSSRAVLCLPKTTLRMDEIHFAVGIGFSTSIGLLSQEARTGSFPQNGGCSFCVTDLKRVPNCRPCSTHFGLERTRSQGNLQTVLGTPTTPCPPIPKTVLVVVDPNVIVHKPYRCLFRGSLQRRIPLQTSTE